MLEPTAFGGWSNSCCANIMGIAKFHANPSCASMSYLRLPQTHGFSWSGLVIASTTLVLNLCLRSGALAL